MNARVYLVTDEKGERHVEKDFSECPWVVRNTIGRFLISREAWVLRRLRATGVVPTEVRKISPFCLREKFCEGETLHFFAPPTNDPTDIFHFRLPRSFFEALEAGVREMHRHGFVHLDLHNSRNIIVGANLRPTLIDWQSSLPTFLVIPPLRRLLERIDLAGVYKFWDKIRPGELGDERRRLLRGVKFARSHFWIPRIHKKTGKSRRQMY